MRDHARLQRAFIDNPPSGQLFIGLWCYITNMKALGLVVSDKIFLNYFLKTYFLTRWPTYTTNWAGLNNNGRGTPRDHSCKVWSKSNEWFQRRSPLNESLLGLGRYSQYWYTINTEDNRYISIRSSCCTDTSRSIISHLNFI